MYALIERTTFRSAPDREIFLGSETDFDATVAKAIAAVEKHTAEWEEDVRTIGHSEATDIAVEIISTGTRLRLSRNALGIECEFLDRAWKDEAYQLATAIYKYRHGGAPELFGSGLGQRVFDTRKVGNRTDATLVVARHPKAAAYLIESNADGSIVSVKENDWMLADLPA